MRQVGDAGPAAWRQEGRRHTMETVGSGHRGEYITGREPVALEVFKRGRWCVVAKVTNLDQERILAIAHRNQLGVKDTISVPLAAMAYAERAGCRWLYFRRDNTAEMWRISLYDLRSLGWLSTSDGIAELFAKIDSMQQTVWRRWQYAERTVRLDEQKHESEQLPMFASVAT